MALPNFQGKANVYIGTSRTRAVGATPTTRWTYYYSQECNAVEVNLGIEGATLLPDGVQFDKATIPVYSAGTHARLFLEFGTNELRIFGGNLYAHLADFKAIYQQAVTYAIATRGWPASVISVQNCYFPGAANPEQFASLNQAIADIATDNNLLLIDYYASFANRPNVSSLFQDGIHENPAGQRAIADFYESLSGLGAVAAPAVTGIRFSRRLAVSQARVAGAIPVDTGLDISSLQSPPLDYISTLFSTASGAPADQYGAMFNPTDSIVDFPAGMDVQIDSFMAGSATGDQTGRELTIYGTRADGAEVLLFTYSGAGSFPATTPGRYQRLRYHVLNNGRPHYAFPVGSYVPVVRDANPDYPKFRLGNHTGINCHPYDLLQNPNDGNQRGSIYPPTLEKVKQLAALRIYLDNGNIVATKDEYRYDIDYQGFSIDQMFTTLKANGIKTVLVMQGGTPWLNAGYPNAGSNNERVPVYYGANQLEPSSWEDYATIGEQHTIRYGRNTAIPLSRSLSKEGYFYPNSPELGGWTKKVGLGLVDEIELNNEWFRSWKGTESYCSGHESAVGVGVMYNRIKAVDPTMKATFPGLPFFTTDELQEFVYWSLKIWGFIPCDNYAYHFYPSSAGSQYSGTDSIGYAIEQSGGPANIRKFRRSNYFRLGNKPFDCGEDGYDSTTNSPLRAVVPTGSTYTQREWAGVLYFRLALFNAKNGVRRTYHYQWADLNNDQYNQFSAMGFIYAVGTAPNVLPAGYPNFNLLAQLQASFPEYTHVSQVSASPLVDRWQDPSGKVLYSLYYDTQVNQAGNYVLNLPAGGALYRFSLSSTTTPPPVSLPAGNNTIAITETPCFVVATSN